MNDTATQTAQDAPVVETPVIETPVADAAPVVETPVVETLPEPPARHEAPRWALERISQESARARDFQEQLETERRARRDAEALAERLRQPQQDHQQPPQRQEAQPPHDVRDQISREAARQVYLRDVEDVRAKGLSQYGAEFNDTIRAITAYGVDDAFLQDVIDADRGNAAATLRQLSQDADRTIAMTHMSSRQRLAELTRMTMQPTKDTGSAPAPKAATSKAPPPAPPVQPAARQEVDWRSDKSSDADFTTGFRESFKKRHGHYPTV